MRGLFDGHSSATTYPSDVSLLYAYFPCFTQDRERPREQLRERISLVLRRSLNSVNSPGGVEPGIEVEKLISLFWHHFGEGDLFRRGAILEALGKAWCEYRALDYRSTTIVFKETSQAIYFEELKTDFSSLQMIHVLRDPRDNYAALKAGVRNYYARLGEGELETLASLINRCRMDMMTATVNSQLHPDSFLAIKFEDLVRQPKAALDRICQFLGWEFQQVMLSPTRLGLATSGNSHEGRSFQDIDSSHADAWRGRISADEAKVIEYWCEREMRDWGYEPEFSASERQNAFAHFYAWYNCRYFYSDSFGRP